jgi:hypothetical protein
MLVIPAVGLPSLFDREQQNEYEVNINYVQFASRRRVA